MSHYLDKHHISNVKLLNHSYFKSVNAYSGLISKRKEINPHFDNDSVVFNYYYAMADYFQMQISLG